MLMLLMRSRLARALVRFTGRHPLIGGLLLSVTLLIIALYYWACGLLSRMWGGRPQRTRQAVGGPLNRVGLADLPVPIRQEVAYHEESRQAADPHRHA